MAGARFIHRGSGHYGSANLGDADDAGRVNGGECVWMCAVVQPANADPAHRDSTPTNGDKHISAIGKPDEDPTTSDRESRAIAA